MKGSDLIAALNANVELSPDEIVAALGNPFDNWRLGKHITVAEYEKYRDLPIVVLYHAYHNRPNHIDSSRASVGEWTYYGQWMDWLGQDYYVRSQESYDANPNEVVDLTAQFCSHPNLRS